MQACVVRLVVMVAFDATEALTPCRDGRGYGAILFDRQHLRQAETSLFSPAHWGDKARPVGEGGRGGAWFVDAPFGRCVLRHYLRGGLAEMIKHGFIADPRTLELFESDPRAMLTPGSDALAEAVARSMEVKAGVVAVATAATAE